MVKERLKELQQRPARPPRVFPTLRNALGEEAYKLLVREGRSSVSFPMKHPGGGVLTVTVAYSGPMSGGVPGKPQKFKVHPSASWA